MVGSRMFNKADIRLRQIFDCNKFFGGLNVIAIGDFYQMRPVRDCYVFKNPGFSHECLAPNPWTENFEIFSLTQIMRQKEEKHFCEVLNRLRKSQCTEEDHKLFKSCIVKKDSKEYDKKIMHIFPFARGC